MCSRRTTAGNARRPPLAGTVTPRPEIRRLRPGRGNRGVRYLVSINEPGMRAAPATPPAAPPPEGSHDPLERFFARHQAELLGTLYFLVGNLEDARDALQETFVKCWRHRETAAGVDNLRAWVFREIGRAHV